MIPVLVIQQFFAALAEAVNEQASIEPASSDEDNDDDDDDDDEKDDDGGGGGGGQGCDGEGDRQKVFVPAASAPDCVLPAQRAAGIGLRRYLERCMELFIDLLAQLPTRRFFHALLLDAHVLERAELSTWAKSSGRSADLFRQLLVLAKKFEV